MRIVAIVQARMKSSRLPGKVMKLISGHTLIDLLMRRLSRSILIDKVVVATSCDESNNHFVEHVKSLGYQCIQGSEDNVLERYIEAAEVVDADVIVRITGDCPLVDPALVDDIIRGFLSSETDYYSNTIDPTFPDGLDVEVFSYKALKLCQSKSTTLYDKEHVTPYLRDSGEFKTGSFTNSEDLSDLRWTVDELSDLDVIRNIFEWFSPNIHFNWKDVLQLQKAQPESFIINKSITRNEGMTLGRGQKLWKFAKKIIPGGNMLLSKRAEMFLPDQWPAYFSKAKGCRVWDLDGQAYTDMSVMGIGTNILGYGHPEVDAAVMEGIKSGNMSTLNAPEEVSLAEKLIDIHPWADMVRFARSGGEANAIAIRIARAATGRENVAVCGYHGWHDWYISANLGDSDGLSGHLLPGLDPNGVPSSLRGTAFPFNYNDFQGLKDLVDNHEIGVIKMEVVRNSEPENNFLHEVRKLATRNGIVLIFDECTSGFRESYGGLHKKYGVEPDMAMFGKALGNGYAVTAVIGRREVMEAAQTSFISSTFWTERIGSVAALKCLEIMERDRSWETITQAGLKIRRGWQKLAEKYELPIVHMGLPALAGFSFNLENSLKYKTLITQEMLKKGFLAGTSIYASIEHTESVINDYFSNLEPVFELIKECEMGQSVDDLLTGPVCHDGFKRLN
tara:strand:+ start:4772 stop:6799 length:2028 start_codon:yes stop_codon:yes gene_type:complete